MFDKLKKALGFGTIDENDELLDDDKDRQQPVSTAQFAYDNVDTAEDPSVSVEDTVHEIFEHVVARFNEALPDFLRKSVDPEKEQKLLHETLSDDVKAHLSRLEDSVAKRVEGAWRAEREKLQHELKEMSRSAKDIEAKRNELRTQQLSADRQKRAMTERIHELEKQLLTSEAEKEQLELENKSMLNKVKVAQVYEKDIEDMREHINALQSEIAGLRSGKTDGDSEQSAAVVPDPETGRLKDENEGLKAKVAEMTAAVEEYNQMIDKMEQVEEQLNRIIEMNREKDAKIREYKTLIDENQALIQRKDSEIEELRRSLAEKEASAPADYEASALQAPPAVAAEDDNLTDTDWTVQTTPGRSAKPQGGARHERGKNKRDREDGQMSLW